MVHLLSPTPPYDLAKAREFMTSSDGVEPSPNRRTLIRSWVQPATDPRQASEPVAVRIEDVGTVTHPQLEAELVVGDERRWPQIEQVLRRSLSLDFDVAPIVAAAADDPPFRTLLEQSRGYHQVCFPTPFEAAAWAILTQQTFRTLARANWRRLVEALGARVVVDGREVDCFPDARTVASRGVDLRTLLPRRRQAEYLLNAAETFCEELADPDAQWLDTYELESLLRAVPGLGPWSAELVLIRGFGQVDELHLVGPALRKAASALYGERLTDRQVLQRAQRYAAAPGYWAHLIRAFGPAGDDELG